MAKTLDMYNAQFPKEGMDVLIAGLNELPHKIARPVFDALLLQLKAQEAIADVQAQQESQPPSEPTVEA